MAGLSMIADYHFRNTHHSGRQDNKHDNQHTDEKDGAYFSEKIVMKGGLINHYVYLSMGI